MKRLILIAWLCDGLQAQPNSNWATNWVKITGVPSAFVAKTAGIGNMPDGYLYISSCAGVWRATRSSVAADATDTANWTQINGGLPASTVACATSASPVVSSIEFDYVNGRVYATFCEKDGGHGHVGYFDEGTQAWVLETVTPATWNSHPPLYLAHDASNNIYAGQGAYFKSSDGGANWTCPLPNGGSACNAYSDVPIAGTPGFFGTPVIYGGRIYGGGEGPLVIYDLPGFTNFEITLRTTNSSCVDPDCYCHNMRGLASDGNITTGAQYEMLALIDHGVNGTHCASVTSPYLQRWDIASSPSTKVWTTPTAPATMAGWLLRVVVPGTTLHEYYVTGGVNSSASGTGVYGTVDGGVTWATVGQLFTTNGSNQTQFQFLAIGSDDSKIVSREGSGTIPADVWFHPGVATASGSTSLGGNLTVSGKTVIQ